MTTQDKIKVIAEYDGWVDDMHNMYVNTNYNKGTLMYLSDMPYLTSLDWLHPPTMKLLNELRQFKDGEDLQHMIFVLRHHCAIPPINGEYRDLFNAVIDGLLFLRLKR